MKKLFTIALFLTAMFINAQEKPSAEMNFTETTINSLKFSVDSPEELKEIKWEDIKEIFSDNKPDDMIVLEFEVNYPKSEDEYMRSYKFSAKGKTENIDKTIATAKKMLKSLNKFKDK